MDKGVTTMGFRIYKCSLSGEYTDSSRDTQHDFLKSEWWDETVGKHDGPDFYELLTWEKHPSDDADKLTKIYSKDIQKWYNLLLPHASQVVDTSLVPETFNRSIHKAEDVMLSFMKRTLDADDCWIIY